MIVRFSRQIRGLALLAAAFWGAPAEAADPIRLALNWKAEPQFGGFYAAREGGHFAAKGLDVNIIEGGTLAVTKLANGGAPSSIGAASNAAASLPVHSFAFVLHSKGVWTYAIVADRPALEGPEVCIRFVLNKGGSTKTVKRKYWGRYIRLVRNGNDGECENRMQSNKCRINDGRRQVHGEEITTKEMFERLDSFQRAVRRVSADLSIRTKDHW